MVVNTVETVYIIMRPTKIIPRLRDKSPTVINSPSTTPTSQQSQEPTDNTSTETPSELNSGIRARQESNYTPSLNENRPRRTIKPPIRFKDYVCG